jgi:hypothetical protein
MATYVGNGLIIESIPEKGVVERPIDVYRSRFVRLGVYRLCGMTRDMTERGLSNLQIQVGREYGFKGAIKLGLRKFFARLLFGDGAYDVPTGTTPNDHILSGMFTLVDYV